MYKVVKFFTDLQDNEHPYKVGDTFPREGVTVSEARYKELSTNANKQGVPVIKEVAEEKPDINHMNVKELHKLAGERGIKDHEDMIGSELKREIAKSYESTAKE